MHEARLPFHFWGKLAFEAKMSFVRPPFWVGGFLTETSRGHEGPCTEMISLVSNWDAYYVAFMRECKKFYRTYVV